MEEYKTDEFKEQLKLFAKIYDDFLFGLNFCIHDTGRNSDFWDNHLFSFLAQDIVESSFFIFWLAKEGCINPCKRELRFLLELAIKQTYIEQQMPTAKVDEKIKQYEKLLHSPNISIKKDINLGFLSKKTKESFLDDVGRFYGSTSKYVHLSVEQIERRIKLVKDGKTIGKEGIAETEDLISYIKLGYSLFFVLIFHSIPSYVAGDFLVESDGTLNNWYFRKSKYIAQVDSYFDYKAERQDTLKTIQEKRNKMIEF